MKGIFSYEAFINLKKYFMADPVVTPTLILGAIAGATSVAGAKGAISGIISDSGTLFQKVFITVLVMFINMLQSDDDLMYEIERELEYSKDKVKKKMLGRVKKLLKSNKKLVPDFDNEEELSTILYMVQHANRDILDIAVRVSLIIYVPAVVILTPYFAVKGAGRAIIKFWTNL